MATLVLVPGAWLGGWCWRRVTPILRAAGRDLYTPTLTGLGERVHLATPDTNLQTHVQDVANVLTFEDLDAVVLVGHSYSGFVIAGVAERMPDRLAQLVYLAANVPRDGQSLFDGWSPAGRAAVEEEARTRGDGWRWPLPDDLLAARGPDLTAEDQQWFRAKAIGHPLKTFTERVHLANQATATLPRTFIHCTGDGPELPTVVRNGGTAVRWNVRELTAGHWPMLSNPRELADLLLGLM